MHVLNMIVRMFDKEVPFYGLTRLSFYKCFQISYATCLWHARDQPVYLLGSVTKVDR